MSNGLKNTALKEASAIIKPVPLPAVSEKEKKTKTGGLTRVEKRINLRKQNESEAAEIAKKFELSPVAARIVAARGYKADRVLANYLEPTLKEGLLPPEKLYNLKEACRLIGNVVQSGGAIAVCCDFDVDGLTGGAQIHHFFKSIGVNSKVFVPDRFEDGYGLNENMVRQIAAEKFALMVAVDYGTTNVKELELARKLGLQSVVIDHHHVASKPPPADIFINPHQKNCGFADGILCASGLAWYLLAGLKQELKGKIAAIQNVDVRTYLDLACLGTICDMVPLTGINRVIARRGLERLSITKRTGLAAMKSVMSLNGTVNCHDVSFGIGPRLNAAGRMVNGQMVIELLSSDDEEQTRRIAKTLNDLNLERQATEEEVKLSALRQLENRYGGGELPYGLVVSDESFHTGVIGIVAQRLVEAFHRPAVVFGVDNDGVLKGSARGVPGFNVVEAFSAVSEHLIKFGGHEAAGGCAVMPERFPDFMQAFLEECKLRLGAKKLHATVEADTEVTISELSVPLVEELSRFAPFGMGNPGPIVLLRNLKVQELREIKGTHLKVIFVDNENRHLTGMLWRQARHPALVKGAKVNIACKPDYNTYNGLTEIVGNLQAIELAG